MGRKAGGRYQQMVLDAVRAGPGNVGAMMARLNMSYQQAQSLLSFLKHNGRIVSIGCAAQAWAAGRADVTIRASGYKHVRADAMVYAVPGTEPLPALTGPVPHCVRVVLARSTGHAPRASNYQGKPAGRITIPQYRWWGGDMGLGAGPE